MTPEQMLHGSAYLATHDGLTVLATIARDNQYTAAIFHLDGGAGFVPRHALTDVRPAAIVDANVCAEWDDDGYAVADQMKRDEAMRVIDDAFWNATHEDTQP